MGDQHAMKNNFSRSFAKLLLPITLFCAVLLGAYLLTVFYFGNPANYKAVFAGTQTTFLLSCGCGVVLGCAGTLLLLKRKKNNLYFAPTLACAGCWVSVFAVLFSASANGVAEHTTYRTCAVIFAMFGSAFLSAGVTLGFAYHRNSTAKAIGRMTAGVAVLLLLAIFIPTKLCLHALPNPEKGPYYIVDPSDSTIVGDENGFFEESARKTFSLERQFGGGVSQRLWQEEGTLFILYGEAQKEEGSESDDGTEHYRIVANDWDVYGAVSRHGFGCAVLPRHYLNLYDSAWVDAILDRLFFIHDGQTAYF